MKFLIFGLSILGISAIFLLQIGEEKPANFGGLWKMHETNWEYKEIFQTCLLEITQTGDRVQIKSWSDDRGWSCVGRGEVKGNLCHFRYGGGKKGWKGTTIIKLENGKLCGTYSKEGFGTDTMYCCGTRVELNESLK